MFDDYFELIARDFEKSCKVLGLSTEYVDCYNSKTSKKFDSYLEALSKISEEDLIDTVFENIPESVVLSEIEHFMTMFFGEIVKEDTIKNYINSIVKIDAPNPFDSVILSCVNEKTKETVLAKVEIPGMNSTGAIVSGIHEGTHYILESGNQSKTLKNAHYRELISILMEKIVSDMLEKEGYSKVLCSTQVTRVSSLLFHQEQYKELKLLSKVKCDKSIKDQISYGMHMSYTYLISSLFADYLYKKYLNYKDDVMKDLNLLFSQQKSLPSVLKKYGVSLSNYEVLESGLLTIKNSCK